MANNKSTTHKKSIKRTPVTNLYQPIIKKFCGISSVVNPITDQDLIEAGALAEHIETYVQNEQPFSWEQYVTIGILKSKRHIYIQGESSAGKDSLVQQIAAEFRIPFKVFSFKDGATPNHWINRIDLKENQNGEIESTLIEGELSKAVKGFQSKNGNIYPYLVLLSDIDRAKPADLDILKHALQIGNSAFLINPIDGKAIPILKGTIFVATGNSGVDSSTNGHMIYQKIDASMINRFLKIKAYSPSNSFEQAMIKKEFPFLPDDDVLLVVNCLHSIKKAIRQFNYPLEFGMRDASNWTKFALDLLNLNLVNNFSEGMEKAFDVVVRGAFQDETSSDALYGALDLYLKINPNRRKKKNNPEKPNDSH
jgi:hypothetical protein